MINFTPPPQIDKKPPSYIFDRPEVEGRQDYHNQKSCYFFIDEYVKE